MAAPSNPVPQLPHGVPFVLLDRVLDVSERSGVFLKLVSATDPCLASDGRLPAAFVLEALAQAGGALLAALRGGAAAPGYLAAVDRFRMLGDVRAGDQLRVEVEMLRSFGGAFVFHARGLVDGEVRAEGRITLKPPG